MSRRVDPNLVLDQVKDRKSFYKFVLALAEDREESVEIEQANPSSPFSSDANGWENTSIEGFLSAAVSCAKDSDDDDAQPSWRLFAEFLYGGKIYE